MHRCGCTPPVSVLWRSIMFNRFDEIKIKTDSQFWEESECSSIFYSDKQHRGDWLPPSNDKLVSYLS
jgi:hypothetical protein